MAEEMIEIKAPGQIRHIFEDKTVPDALKNILAWMMHYTPDPEILDHRLFGFELGLRFYDHNELTGLNSLRALDDLQRALGIPLGQELDKAISVALTTPFQWKITDAG